MNAAFVSLCVESLGWTLVHFVWQGVLNAALLWAALGLVRQASSNLRYAMSCTALGLMTAATVATFAWQLSAAGRDRTADTAGVDLEAADGSRQMTRHAASGDVSTEVPQATASAAPAGRPPSSARSPVSRRIADLLTWMPKLRPWLSTIVGVWAIGVGLLCLRLFVGWNTIRRIRRGGREIEESYWIERLARMRQALGIPYRVRFVSTTQAAVPFVVGWLKPVVLVPAGLLTGLGPVELEAILTHELAHVRRHDFLVNVLQTVVETLFFYHPAIWWVSGQIRREREHCCDQIAAASTGDRLIYARALVALEEQRRTTYAFGVAASGGSLTKRIRRLVGESPARRSRSGWPIAALLLVSGLLVGLAAASSLDGQEQPSSTAPAPQENPANAEPQANQDSIAIRVLDAKDKKPISEFRVLAGVPSQAGTPPEVFTKRAGGKVVNWQPHTVRAGKDGEYAWPLGRGYPEMALRVEADGYQPQRSHWIKKSNVPREIEFLLIPDSGTAGRVLQPDGTPASGATAALALPQKNARIEHGRIRGEFDSRPEKESDRWRRPTIVKSDAEGRFVLPTETDPASAILVVHETGVREMPAMEFQKRPEIMLLPWGRIEGQVLWRDKPGADEPVDLSIWRDEYGYPGMIGQHAETMTDAQGRFVFDKILPGHVQLSRYIELPQKGKSGATSALCEGMYTHATIRPGEPTPVVIGGQGRLVTGRLSGRDSWEGVTLRMHPNAPHIGLAGDNEQWQAFGIFRASAIGPLFFRDRFQPNADGAFAIPNVLPGRYQLWVSAPGVDNYAAYKVIQVDPEPQGAVPPPLDIGEIAVKPPDNQRSAEKAQAAAPIFVLDKLDVKAQRVIFKGKIDASRDLVLRIERKDEPLKWKSGGSAGWFQVVVEASDKMKLEGGKTGHGIMVSMKTSLEAKFGRDFSGSVVTNFIALVDGGIIAGKFTVRRRADFETKDGTVTFADVTQKDGTKLPVSLRVEPRIE